MNGKFTIKTAAAVGVGAAVFFVCGRFLTIPIPIQSTYIAFQYGVLAFMAAVFGPIAGALIGFIGHTLVDLSSGEVWWTWVAASAIFGAMMGFGTRRLAIADGVCRKKEIIRFNLTQIVCQVVCWGLIAPILDILIYRQPVEMLFAQGLVAGISNAVTTAVIGSLLCIVYARVKQRGNSQGKD